MNRHTVGGKSQICNGKLQPTPDTTYISSAHARFSPHSPQGILQRSYALATERPNKFPIELKSELVMASTEDEN